MGTPADSMNAEASLLGALLVDNTAFDKVFGLVTTADFVNTTYAAIFDTYTLLREAGGATDILTIHDALKGTAPATLLNDLASWVPTGYSAVSYANIVHEAAQKRRITGLSRKIASTVKSGEGTAQDVLERTERALLALADKQPGEAISSLEEVLTGTLERIDQAERGLAPVGLSTGFREMDAILTGFQPSDLFILAARPSMGKTAFALNLARNVAQKSEASVLIFSLEMGKSQLVDRLLSMETGVSTERLRSGQLGENEQAKVMASMGELADLPVYIDDTAGATVQQVRVKARRHQRAHGLELIIVDYLQLMSGGGRRESNRVQEMSDISRGLKVLARELNVPVIALSQLSRNVESRDIKIPQLSDLRDSGSIEQDADIVAFLYRDDYYNPDTIRKNMTDVVIRKHRNGRLGTVELYFDRNQQRFRGVTV